MKMIHFQNSTFDFQDQLQRLTVGLFQFVERLDPIVPVLVQLSLIHI